MKQAGGRVVRAAKGGGKAARVVPGHEPTSALRILPDTPLAELDGLPAPGAGGPVQRSASEGP